MDEHFELLNSTDTRSSLFNLDRVITIGDEPCVEQPVLNEDYETFLASAVGSDSLYDMATESVRPSDIASLQFTSGQYNPSHFANLGLC